MFVGRCITDGGCSAFLSIIEIQAMKGVPQTGHLQAMKKVPQTGHLQARKGVPQTGRFYQVHLSNCLALCAVRLHIQQPLIPYYLRLLRFRFPVKLGLSWQTARVLQSGLCMPTALSAGTEACAASFSLHDFSASI